MIVKLKKKRSRYRDLTFGQSYVVIGIEADDLRITSMVRKSIEQRLIVAVACEIE